MWSNATHEELENLCPLAVVGQLSEEEQARWNAHIIECVSCRAEFDEYADLLHHKSLVAGKRLQPAAWMHTAKCADRIAAMWRELLPLGEWLRDNVGASTMESAYRRR